jgi:hypothetical protein
VGEGYLRLVEYVSANEVFFGGSTTNSYRQIFGSIPKNVNEEDMVEPVVSTLKLLMAQRARKAAAKKAEEDSDTEPETQPNIPFENPPVPPPASENPPPVENQHSLDFADEAAVPPRLRHKEVTRNNTHGDSAQHNPRPTSPVASTSAAVHLRQAAPLESLQGQTSQASQQPHGHQTKSTKNLKQRSSPLGKSRRHILKK